MIRQVIACGLLWISSALFALGQNTFPSSGDAGIGTASPTFTLDIQSTDDPVLSIGQTNYVSLPTTETPTAEVRLYNQRGDANKFVGLKGVVFPGQYMPSFVVATSPTYTATPPDTFAVREGGQVGVGTAYPSSPLTVSGAAGQSGATGFPIIDVIEKPTTCSGCTGPGLIGERIVMNQTPGAGSTNVGLWVSATNGTAGNIAAIFQNGDVGIGTNTPGAKLEVDGNLKLTSGSSASMTYADGTVQSTAWTGTLTGGDYAESMDVTGAREQYEPGDVLVLDHAHPGHVLKSSESYSLAVAGVYSTKPGLVGRRQKIAKELATTEVPMAMVGVVPTKVTAENGPIEPGDVLVTSSKAGYAMKGTDRSLFAGAVIGKAMSSLDSGTGVIEALISLQ